MAAAAYYNEFDPYAAQWLRNLIAAGHIAPGDVDERDIQDVRPDDLRGYTQCHFFAGIGVWSLALRRAGWPDDRSVWTGSCPCQPFSAAGKGLAFDDERHLWPAFHWLIQQRRPAVVLGEQVASKDADAWIDLVHADMEGMEYAFGSIPFPSAGVGAPHIRDRNYWMAHANHARSQGRRGMPQRAYQRSAGSRGVVVGLADSHRSACGEGGSVVRGWTSGSDAQPRTGLGSGIVLGGLAYADGGDASTEREQRGGEQRQQPQDGWIVGRMGDADGEFQRGIRGSEGGSSRRIEGEMGGQDGQRHGLVDDRTSAPECAAGPTNSFWRDADWLLCRDGKWRPVEPGTFPLAHGAASRVGRLRAYGNAINAIQAQIWCEVVMEALQ
ncbi:DNA cytosine methyltransferase [Ralstonia mannitolilytica]|uniref:DNA cytosine methyltransferase n=1 Tax=Ralstonia mannitolilytica TaxID=105219 RepID=UPI003B8AD4DC